MARVARVVSGFEECDELADIVVERFHHSAEEGVFLTLIRRPRFAVGRIDAELLAVFVEECLAAGLDRCVNEPSRIVEEERLVLVRLHEIQRALGDGVGGEALGIESEGIAGLVGGEALEAIHADLDSSGAGPLMGGEIKPLVQRARERIMTACHVPLSGVPGFVAIFAKRSGDRLLIRRHAPAEPRCDHSLLRVPPRRIATGDMGGLGAGGMVAAHDGASARCATRSGRIRMAEENATLGESVHIRSIRRARRVDVVAFQLLPTEVVGEHENDVRSGCGVGGNGQSEAQAEQSAFDHGFIVG